jgi:hypothetical protein
MLVKFLLALTFQRIFVCIYSQLRVWQDSCTLCFDPWYCLFKLIFSLNKFMFSTLHLCCSWPRAMHNCLLWYSLANTRCLNNSTLIWLRTCEYEALCRKVEFRVILVELYSTWVSSCLLILSGHRSGRDVDHLGVKTRRTVLMQVLLTLKGVYTR